MLHAREWHKKGFSPVFPYCLFKYLPKYHSNIIISQTCHYHRPRLNINNAWDLWVCVQSYTWNILKSVQKIVLWKNFNLILA